MAKRAGPIGSPESQEESTVPGWYVHEILEFQRDFLSGGVIQGWGDEFEVTEKSSGANMSVDIATGRCLIPITPTITEDVTDFLCPYRTTTSYNKTIAAADATHPRIDLVVAIIDVDTEPDGSGAPGDFDIVTGTPAASPTVPDTPDNAIALYQVAVGIGVTQIENADLTDVRTYADMNDGVLQNVARADILASALTGKGASLIGVKDAAGNFTGTNVESVLAEIVTLISSGGFVSGDFKWSAVTADHTGWLMSDGRTIGDGDSGATGRANEDTEALFTVLWVGHANSELPIQDSSGTPTTRGVSAAADFAEHKRLPIPCVNGHVMGAPDNMGGSDADVITASEAETIGKTYGEEAHALTSAENGPHTHQTARQDATVLLTGAGTLRGANPSGSGSDISTGSSGSGDAHNNIQPTLFENCFIKL